MATTDHKRGFPPDFNLHVRAHRAAIDVHSSWVFRYLYSSRRCKMSGTEDPKVLSDFEKQQLASANEELKAKTESYLNEHPELQQIIQGFVAAAAQSKPPAAELVAFAQKHFGSQ